MNPTSEEKERINAIQYHVEELGFEPLEIPSLSTVKRIIKRNKFYES